MTVDAYIGTDFPDAARFEAIPRRRGIRTLSFHGRLRQENRLAAWRTRWLHVPHRARADPRSDLLYIRCAGEDQYHARLFELFERFSGDVELKPDVRLVAFPRPFDRWNNVTDRARWGDNSAEESRLRWRRTDSYFHMWHMTEFFAVPPAARWRLYPALPNEWSSLEAPQYLCVPTPSALAYVAAWWMQAGPFGREASPETRQLIDATLLSEWAVLSLLCFLHAARDGLPFFTRYPDPRLASRNGNEPGERGSLFRLSPGLFQLIRSVGVAAILDGTAFDLAAAEDLLDFSERLDWSLPERGDFVWYSWARGCFLRMPYWDGAWMEADDWYEPLPSADPPLYGVVIATGDGCRAAVSSARPPWNP